MAKCYRIKCITKSEYYLSFCNLLSIIVYPFHVVVMEMDIFIGNKWVSTYYWILHVFRFILVYGSLGKTDLHYSYLNSSASFYNSENR